MIDEVLFEQRLREFNPQPLVTPVDTPTKFIETPVIEEDGNNIDLAKVNYLDVLNNEQIKQTAEEIIREYGVGTCGPRAFYGTTDVHLELEKCLAKFLGMEESIVYSYGFVTISSSIAAYCKRNDVVFVDEHTNFAIEQGLTAARCKVVRFEHNNPKSLREKIREVTAQEKKKSRKYLVIEGVSWYSGKLCPLPEFLAVTEEFKIRIFLEESYSLGVFGDTGRGLTEFYNVDPTRIDMIFGTLEGALGSIGGFCAGSSRTIEHQRLSGSGYIFSASLPTYLAKVVIKSIEILGEKPKQFAELTQTFHKFLEEDCGFNVVSYPRSPFKIIRCTEEKQEEKIHKFCADKGVHFILKDNGLVLNWNVAFLDDAEKLGRIYRVLKEASSL